VEVQKEMLEQLVQLVLLERQGRLEHQEHQVRLLQHGLVRQVLLVPMVGTDPTQLR
jgi:hypothetical protein